MQVSVNGAQNPENILYGKCASLHFSNCGEKTAVHHSIVRCRDNHCRNPAAADLNLLGTDFIDNYCLIDDYMSGNLLCLLRKLDGTRRCLPSC